jgi:hypothetical protein
MGTSHRHTPTVKGEPNWGKSSAAVTALTGAIAGLNELMYNPPADFTSRQIEKRERTLEQRKAHHYRNAVRHLISAAGGRAKVSSGTSQALGRAGVVGIGGFIATLQDIVTNGLLDWLRQRGESLDGKTCRDVIDLIRKYADTEIAGLDSTAANEALECVLEQLQEKMGEDIENIDSILGSLIAGDELKNMLDLFFGMYIFCHLSQNFEEKIEFERGSDAMRNTMTVIKDQILDDIKTCRSGRDVRKIDWSNKSEGDAFIKEEFDRILYILEGDEN